VTLPADQPIVAMTDPISSASIETINQDSPLQPVYFAYDSDLLDERARGAMTSNADVLRKYASWVVTIEGHCDERGTPEYNLALGERRAQAVKNYMVSLGIPSERLKTVSYGSEFPFAPGHDESSYSQNRRAHFMLTARQ
jgi:peptidoglycan-associated lipoprotein